MYSLLVVDNEPIIVESILDMFERTDALDLEVYGAYSSAEALKLLATTKIDVVLTDIRMPGMSGIELHREIIKHWPWCKVIFLSGYNDFEFIQEVMRNGGVDYLLKTEGDQAIIRAVQKAVQALSDAIEVENLIHKSKKQMQMIQPYLQKELLWGLVQGEPYALHTIHDQFRELNIPLSSAKQTIVVIGRIDRWSESTSSVDKSLLLFAIQNIAEEYFSKSTCLVSFDIAQKTKVVWLIQTQEVSDSDADSANGRTVAFVKGAAEMIQITCKQLLKLNVSFAVGTTYRDWHHVSEQFEHLQLLLSRGLGLGHGLLLLEQQAADMTPPAIDRELRKQLSKLNLLQSLLDNGQKEQFFFEYGSIMEAFAMTSPQSNPVKMEVYFTLISIFLSYMNRWGVQDEIGKLTNLGKMTMLDYQTSWKEVADYFYALANRLFDQKMSVQGLKENDVIRQVQQYVRQNLAGDLSLNRIGDVVGHNPSYLSRLYKQIANEGLSDYIMAARLSKAKELLRENKLKIHEISKAVGFLSRPLKNLCFLRASRTSCKKDIYLHF